MDDFNGRGKGIAFLRANVAYQGDDCLMWPMSRNPNGYGMLGVNKKHRYAHRVMCELVNGPPPGPKHDATHSCGKGHEGCVNPRHLSWKTRSGNMLDAARVHRTHPGGIGTKGQLKPEEVLAIRLLKGVKTQEELATMFGVKPPTIRDIYSGRCYSHIRD